MIYMQHTRSPHETNPPHVSRVIFVHDTRATGLLCRALSAMLQRYLEL